MNTNLPIYQLIIDENDNDVAGVDYVALVDQPAIERDFIAFNNAKPIQFSVQNEDKRIISGPLMIAGLPIYRRDPQMGEYYCVFTADTIRKICMKFHRNYYQHNTNAMHDSNQQLDGVYMFESWLVDRSMNKQPLKGFEDVHDGSWFGSYKVTNDQVWQSVKDGTYKGFSVEGYFMNNSTPLGMKELQVMQAIEDFRKVLFGTLSK